MSTNEATTIGLDDPVDTNLQQKRHQQDPQPPIKTEETVHQFTSSGMTPSIITTINNTNPSPLLNQTGGLSNNNSATPNNAARTNRRNNEPYESYIEDSFVGHWEHEDDGYEHQEDFDAEFPDGSEQEKSDLQHPSTIEFDFDSFGPESIIYAPNNVQQINRTPAGAATATTRPPPLMEVSREVERANESPSDITGTTSAQEANVGHRNEYSPEDPSDLLRRTRALNLSPSNHLVDLSEVDLKVIEPYKKVISHAGYCYHYESGITEPKPGEQAPAVIVFSACYLPDRSRRDYNYVMDHLFLYVLSSLHELIADDYILIYLHNTQTTLNQSSGVIQSTSRDLGATTTRTLDSQTPNNLPTFGWMKRCYQMIDRKLRKNLKVLYLVKPTFWLKTIVIMCKPFISTKFSKKLKFVEDMDALRRCMPVDKLILPASAENI